MKSKRIKTSIFFVLTFLMLTNIFAQEEKFAGYLMESISYKFHPDWSLYIELQQRALEDFPTPDYYEFKGGLTYFISDKHQPFIGLGRYVTHKNHQVDKQEFRVWLQYVFSHNIDRVKFEHRGRAEQRFYYEPIKDLHSKANRYRYRLNITVPINHPKVQPKTFFINTFDEIFFVNDHPTFARNRFYAGTGYKFTDLFSMGIGYMNQKEFLKDANKIFHFAYMSLNFNIEDFDNDSNHTVPVAD